MKLIVEGKVISGYGVASGKGNDSRYPNGTLILQLPYFKEKGLDLSGFYRGTLNIDISPHTFTIKKPTYYLKDIDWSDHIPPENFYFFEVTLLFKERKYEGLIYMPDPKTKTDHHQINTMLEIMMPFVEGIENGSSVKLEIAEECISFR
jgi:hypothetical protein